MLGDSFRRYGEVSEPAMPKVACECGTEYSFTEGEFSSGAGKPFTCWKCGKTRKLPQTPRTLDDPGPAFRLTTSARSSAPPLPNVLRPADVVRRNAGPGSSNVRGVW